MAKLRVIYEGAGETSKLVTLAEAEIKNLHYRSEQIYPFATFSTKLKGLTLY